MITMRKLTTHSTWTEYAKALNAREAFRTSGALEGYRVGTFLPPAGRTGLLPAEYRESYTQAVYAVYSYDTPIAWYRDDTGSWEIPDVRYSTTTSKHQSKIRTAVGELS